MPRTPVALPPLHEPKRKKRWMRRLRRASAIAGPFALALGVVVFLWTATVPQFGTGSYAIDNGPPMPFTLPLHIPNDPKGNFEIRLPLTVGYFHSSSFLFVTDDCLRSMTVNDIPILDSAFPFCHYDQSHVVHLGTALHLGRNLLVIQGSNDGGGAGLIVQTAPQDRLLLALELLTALVFVWAAMASLRTLGRHRPDMAIAMVILAGCALRVAYMLSTPAPLRGHDTDGHIEYFRFIASHWHLPPSQGGWEYWQPPLYYLLSSVWYMLGSVFSWTDGAMLFGVQVQSLILMIAALVLAGWICYEAFPGHGAQTERLLFLSIIATFPGLVYLTAFINNDVLECTLGFLFLALLLQWWKKPHVSRRWFPLAIVAVLAVFTKSNGLLLLPIALLLLLLRTEIRWNERLLHGLAAILIVASASAWLATRSDTSSAQHFMIGNVSSLGPPLELPNAIPNYIVFDPRGILAHPYSNPWTDESRRQYFLEYFFRSAFFGEWYPGDGLRIVSVWILGFAMLLLPVGLWGIIEGLRRKFFDHLPFFVSFAALAGGHTAFRWLSPFSTSQDFRYSPLLLVPAAFFIVYGLSRLPTTLRQMATVIVQTSIILWVILILAM